MGEMQESPFLVFLFCFFLSIKVTWNSTKLSSLPQLCVVTYLPPKCRCVRKPTIKNSKKRLSVQLMAYYLVKMVTKSSELCSCLPSQISPKMRVRTWPCCCYKMSSLRWDVSMRLSKAEERQGSWRNVEFIAGISWQPGKRWRVGVFETNAS
jgi:hypothetical protein